MDPHHYIASLSGSLIVCSLLGVARADGITVASAWARATPPGATVGAIYMDIKNAGPADVLLKVTTQAARTAEVHATRMVAGMMEMRPMPSVPVPAHGEVKFSPEGLHVMLIGLTQPLKQGTRLPFTLVFQRAPPLKAEAVVLSLGATGPN
jgi:periplasmic copper chaperone A